MTSSRPSTCTSEQTHSVAASLEEAARARFATRANRTRSVSGLKPAPREGPADGAVQAEPVPQLVQDVDPAGRAGGRDRQLARLRRGEGLGGVQQPRQGRDQAPNRVLVDLVLPAEVVQDPRARPLRLLVPLVVGQLQVADRPGPGGPRGRLHVGHTPEATGVRHLGQIRLFPLAVFPESPVVTVCKGRTVSLGDFTISR